MTKDEKQIYYAEIGYYLIDDYYYELKSLNLSNKLSSMINSAKIDSIKYDLEILETSKESLEETINNWTNSDKDSLKARKETLLNTKNRFKPWV